MEPLELSWGWKQALAGPLFFSLSFHLAGLSLLGIISVALHQTTSPCAPCLFVPLRTCPAHPTHPSLPLQSSYCPPPTRAGAPLKCLPPGGPGSPPRMPAAAPAQPQQEHTRGITLGHPALETGRLHHWTQQDTFYIRPPLQDQDM